MDICVFWILFCERVFCLKKGNCGSTGKFCLVLLVLFVIFGFYGGRAYGSEDYENDGVYQFVSRLYNVVLERQPDPQGLQGWYRQLVSHNETGAEVARGFLFSDEFLKKSYSNEDFLRIL